MRAGSTLTAFTVEKLKSMGFNGFYVESEIDKDVFVQPLIPDNLKNKIIKDLRMISIKSAMR